MDGLRLGRHSGITRRGKWLILGIGKFALIVGWGTWGDFKDALEIGGD